MASHIWLKQFICPLGKFFYIKVVVQKNQEFFLLSSTAVAVININETTINTALGINVWAKMFPLNDCQRATLRNRLSEERFIIADEIYLVSSAPFCLLHDRLMKYLDVQKKWPFQEYRFFCLVIFRKNDQLKKYQYI